MINNQLQLNNDKTKMILTAAKTLLNADSVIQPITWKALTSVAARFVTMARFVTKVTKRATMPASFVTNEVLINRAGIYRFKAHTPSQVYSICAQQVFCIINYYFPSYSQAM